MLWHPLKLGEWLIVSKFVCLIQPSWCYWSVCCKNSHFSDVATFPLVWWYARPTICPCPRNWWKRRTAVDPFVCPGFQGECLEWCIDSFQNHGSGKWPYKGDTSCGRKFPTSISRGGKSIIWLELYFLSNSNTCLLLLYSWLFLFLL